MDQNQWNGVDEFLTRDVGRDEFLMRVNEWA
jgi:hypothetical protein